MNINHNVAQLVPRAFFKFFRFKRFPQRRVGYKLSAPLVKARFECCCSGSAQPLEDYCLMARPTS